MQLTKSCFSIFAEDFGLMKQYLSNEEIIEILSGLQDLCIFGDTEYRPQTAKQEYCWGKVKIKFDKDLEQYRTRSKAGKTGMDKRWNNKKDNTSDNKSNNKLLSKSNNETDNKKDNHLTLNTLTLNTINKSSLNSDLSVEVASRLAVIVSQKKAIKIHATQKASWAKEIDKLSKRDGISAERISNAIEWYEENVGGQYVPVIESGKSFREKFTKIEDAIKRASTTQSNEIYIRHGIEYRGKDAAYWKALDAEKEAYNGRA